MTPAPPGARSRVFSGMQPTAASLHLGNYLGALQQWVALQDDHEAFYCVVDLHAITAGHDPAELRERTRATAAQFLAAGVDVDRSVLFVQSHVAAHPELAWVLGCITGFGEASRMTQFKDRMTRYGGESITAGMFTYPILQAADILLYSADLVPVGEDQRQHIEITRDLAGRFNTRFGPTFRLPEAFVHRATAKIYDLQQPEKMMSKSIGGAGVAWLLDEPRTIEKKVRTAVTDAGRVVAFDPVGQPGVSNLLTIGAAFSGRPVDDWVAELESGGYGDLKKAVVAAVLDVLEPFQQRYRELLADPAELDRLLALGADKATAVAQPMLTTVYDRVGFLPRGT